MSSESPGGILQDMMQHLEDLVRSELRLVKAEVREETGETLRSGGLLGVALVLGLYAGWLMLDGVAEILEEILPDWLASFLLGGLLGIGAFLLSQTGMERLREANPATREAVDIVRESVVPRRP